MSDNRPPGKPDQRSLDGVLNELRDVLSGRPNDTPAAEDVAPISASAEMPFDPIVPTTPETSASVEETPALPIAPVPLDPIPEPIVSAAPPSRPAPVFEVLAPVLPPASVPPIPRGIETAPENWALPHETLGRDVPPPVLDGPGSLQPAPSWLQPEAGIAPENQVASGEPPIAPIDLAEFSAPPVEVPTPNFLPPIPGTVESRSAAPTPEPEELELDTAEARPEGLVQVACLFPEGEEKSGQAFVNKLREAAGRLKKPMTVQPVFLHTWSETAVDVAAWARSAVLSGADVMFVLAPRASAGLFTVLAKASQDAGTTGRVVALEHVSSPALYADVLAELRRRASGSR